MAPTDLRVDDVFQRHFSLPLSSPLRTAKGEFTDRHGSLVRVRCDGPNGTSYSGVGEATPFPGWTESLDECRERLETAGPGALTELHERGSDRWRETPAARHGLSLAALDCQAQIDERSLGAALAATVDGAVTEPASTVPVNATIGDSGVNETVHAAESAVQDGFECLKLKIGARPLEEDLARVGAVRDAVGDGVVLRVDVNEAWNESQARRGLDRLADLAISYVEQPLSADQLGEHAALRGHGVGIAVDETIATGPSRERVTAVIDTAAADVVVLKPMTVGGPVETLRLAIRALKAGIEPVITTTIDAVVARTAAVHVASVVPNVSACGLATGGLLESDLCADPAPVSDGHIDIPSGAGIAGGAFEGELF